MKRSGFTLIEIICALGIFAIGATVAFALLVAAASAGRRAEHEINASLLAQTVLSDLRSDMSLNLDLSDYPLADPNDPDNPAPAGASPETRYVLLGAEDPAYPGYYYDVAITPIQGPDPNQPWRYLVEVDVRWSEKGRGKAATFAVVMLRGMTHVENPAPPAQAGS